MRLNRKVNEGVTIRGPRLDKALQSSLELIHYNDDESLGELNCCREIQEAKDLEALLRLPGLGHRLNFHALECPTCKDRVKQYWDSAVKQLSPTHYRDFVSLAKALEPLALRRTDSRVNFSAPVPSHFIDLVRKLIDQGRQGLGATSCVFYVRDSYFDDEFRLLACPGVKLPETMHGFLNPETSREIVIGGKEPSFCEDALADPLRRNTSFVVHAGIADEIRPLFGDFVTRENVISSARLPCLHGETVEAVLFINYDTRTVFDEDLKERMSDLLESLVPHLSEISRELQLRDAPTVHQMISILKPVQRLPAIGLNENESLDDYFQSVLDAAMEAAGLTHATGLGTIHLYDQDSQLLSLAAYRGGVQQIEKAQFQYASKGVGVISWVALRGRPIIINDLNSSAFRRIHVSLKNGIRSELAVPMLVGDKLLGVLNLEGVNPGTFSNRHVRAIAYAANIAAVAARLRQEADNNIHMRRLTGGLLDCFERATHKSETMRFGDPSLAHLVGQPLKADWVHIWYYDINSKPCFCDALATDPDFDATKKRPRPRGWSEYICRNNQFIWITDIRSIHRFDAFFWDHHSRVWTKEIPAFRSVPERLNSAAIARGVASELGIPIFDKGRCIGLAWVEYGKPGLHPPRPDQMSMALGFAGGASLIMQWMRLQQTSVAEKPTESLRQHYERELIGVAADLCSARHLSQTDE